MLGDSVSEMCASFAPNRAVVARENTDKCIRESGNAVPRTDSKYGENYREDSDDCECQIMTTVCYGVVCCYWRESKSVTNCVRMAVEKGNAEKDQSPPKPVDREQCSDL